MANIMKKTKVSKELGAWFQSSAGYTKACGKMERKTDSAGSSSTMVATLQANTRTEYRMVEVKWFTIMVSSKRAYGKTVS